MTEAIREEETWELSDFRVSDEEESEDTDVYVYRSGRWSHAGALARGWIGTVHLKHASRGTSDYFGSTRQDLGTSYFYWSVVPGIATERLDEEHIENRRFQRSSGNGLSWGSESMVEPEEMELDFYVDMPVEEYSVECVIESFEKAPVPDVELEEMELDCYADMPVEEYSVECVIESFEKGPVPGVEPEEMERSNAE